LAGKAVQADDDHAGPPVRARRPGAPRARPARRPCLSNRSHQTREGVRAGGRTDPPRAGREGAHRARRARDSDAHTSVERSDGSMRSETVTTIRSAPRQQVFEYMSDIEKLPQWAT